MKLKLDENLDARLAMLLRQAGHETKTVRDQGLRGVADSSLYEHCTLEGHVSDEARVSMEPDLSSLSRPRKMSQYSVRRSVVT